MKKVLTVILAMAIILSVAACGQDNNTESMTDEVAAVGSSSNMDNKETEMDSVEADENVDDCRCRRHIQNRR